MFLLIGDMPSVLTDIKSEICKLSEEVHRFAFDIVFAQLKRYLINLSIMEVCLLSQLIQQTLHKPKMIRSLLSTSDFFFCF